MPRREVLRTTAAALTPLTREFVEGSIALGWTRVACALWERNRNVALTRYFVRRSGG